MRTVGILFLYGAGVVAGMAQENAAPKIELAFGLGGIQSPVRSDAPRLSAGAGVGLQVNYGRRFIAGEHFALYGEIHLLASPLRDVSSSVVSATQNFASLYVTPGVRLKLWPRSRISPYLAAGGGYADYEQSTSQINGQPNSAPRELGRGAVDLAAGLDARVWHWVALRGEIRDFYTGAPDYNVAAHSGGQHNVVASGALVLRWH